MTIIGLVRHGATDWNREFRAQGQRDVPLNEEGVRQARQLADRLAEERWDRVYASSLSRAAETGLIIATAMGRPIDGLDDRLREKTHGRLDGTTVAERVMQWGEGWEELDHGEENVDSLVRRSLDFIHDIVKKHPDERVLVVTHGALIRQTLETLLQRNEIAYIDNTSVSVLERNGAGWDCLLMGCTKHLTTA